MRKFSLLGVALASCLLASAAGSGDKLTGDQIRSLVTGNTVQGSMEASGGYTEFYAEDGTIKGKDNTGANYQGAWSIDGDNMCFQYGDDPIACWQVAKEGDQIQWVKDGKIDGTGTLMQGNPNNF
ncbi:MAG TPA: hypothetical protein VH835_10155 [Dongiaceae bacterium]|jgi:hypothetical protein